MGIVIENEDYERMIRLLAAHRGTSEADAVGAAVRGELERAGVSAPEQLPFTERVRYVQAMLRDAPILDPRSADEIIGYDERGLPS